MHRDISLELQANSAKNMQEQQAMLDVWRNTYNHERPHEAISMKGPADLYKKSDRVHDREEIVLEYPVGYLKRRIHRTGTVKVHTVASEYLKHYPVGM